MTLQLHFLYERAKAGCWRYTFGRDRKNIFNPILPKQPKYSFTFPCFTYDSFISGSFRLLQSYTRVVEWVLGRPAELYPAGKVLYGLMLDRPIRELGIMVMLLGVIRGMSSGERRWLSAE